MGLASCAQQATVSEKTQEGHPQHTHHVLLGDETFNEALRVFSLEYV